MASGPKKRRAARKKKKAKASKRSVSSPANRTRHGASDAGEVSSSASKGQCNSPHPAVQAGKREGDSCGNRSLTIERTEKATKEKEAKTEEPAKETEGRPEKAIIEKEARTDKAVKEKEANIAIERGSNSQKRRKKSSSSRSSTLGDKSYVVKKEAVELEPAPVVELVQPIESLQGKGTPKVKELAVETNSVVDPVKPADSLVKVASQVNNSRKLQEENDSVIAEMPFKQKVGFNENASKDNHPTTSGTVESVPKENGVEKLLALDEKASAKSKDNVEASTCPKCPVCGRSGAIRAEEPETPEDSVRQPLLASAPRVVEKSSWKSCCGIFELFSGSNT